MALAVAILGIVGVAFLSALVTGNLSIDTLDSLVQAEGLARSQLEDIKNTAFNTDVACHPDCYSTTVTVPADFSVTVATEQLDFTGSNALQKVSVSVSRVGNSRPILILTTYKIR